MLKDLPFSGTTRVINKGVDAALVIRPEQRDAALTAAKICGVRGVSTAVLEVGCLCPPDQRTLEHFCHLTGCVVFGDRDLLAAHVIPAGAGVAAAPSPTPQGFTGAVFALRKTGASLSASDVHAVGNTAGDSSTSHCN